MENQYKKLKSEDVEIIKEFIIICNGEFYELKTDMTRRAEKNPVSFIDDMFENSYSISFLYMLYEIISDDDLLFHVDHVENVDTYIKALKKLNQLKYPMYYIENFIASRGIKFDSSTTGGYLKCLLAAARRFNSCVDSDARKDDPYVYNGE